MTRVPNARLVGAMKAMVEREEAPIAEHVAPLLRCDPDEAHSEMHHLAHVTLDELASGTPDGVLGVCEGISYALSCGLLIGYQLGHADGLGKTV
jgi:hypothetical protein